MTTPIAEVMPYSAIFEKEAGLNNPRIVAGLANLSGGNGLRLKLPKGANTLQLATQYTGKIDVYFSDGTPGSKVIKSYLNGGGGYSRSERKTRIRLFSWQPPTLRREQSSHLRLFRCPLPTSPGGGLDGHATNAVRVPVRGQRKRKSNPRVQRSISSLGNRHASHHLGCTAGCNYQPVSGKSLASQSRDWENCTRRRPSQHHDSRHSGHRKYIPFYRPHGWNPSACRGDSRGGSSHDPVLLTSRGGGIAK